MFASFWNEPYKVPHRRFRTTTKDGVSLAGVHLAQNATDTVVVYAHGFLSNKNHRGVPRFVSSLGRHYDVIAFDFRGHGESDGECTFTEHEVLDLEAVVAYAYSLGYEHVVTMGSSMGGAAVIRHAALYGQVHGVATIGAFDDARALRRPATRATLSLLFDTPIGPTLAEFTRGTCLGSLVHGEQPIDLVQGIDVPTMFIHGEWDHLISPDAARRLYESTPDPKRLVIVPRSGHDLPHLSADTAEMVAEWITDNIAGGRQHEVAA